MVRENPIIGIVNVQNYFPMTNNGRKVDFENIRTLFLLHCWLSKSHSAGEDNFYRANTYHIQ